MVDIGKRYGTDETAELEGTWVDMGEGLKIKIARLNNPNYVKVHNRLMQPYRGQTMRGTMSPEVTLRITCESLAETILLDWDGMEYNGKKLPHSTANALKVLTEFKDFREDVIFLAAEKETFRAEALKEDQKNSASGSAGT
ncbi:MAG: hypothetical protein QGH25_00440 [Candidatus Latescibacteria bacterium]|jgi:hypothetical protein|nr:hypothetical protein [Candidatus Latescibacterota bacterium]